VPAYGSLPSWSQPRLRKLLDELVSDDGGPGEVVHSGRYHSKGSRVEHNPSLPIEPVSHSNVEIPANHRHMFVHGVEVWRDPVARRHQESHREGAGFRGIAIQDRETGASG